MIKLTLKQKDNLTYYYDFYTAGLNGVIVVNKDTEKIFFQQVLGLGENDEKYKETVLYNSLKAIKNCNYANTCLWASH